MGELRQKVIGGVVWAMLEKLSMQIVTFGVTLVLARLLTPADYGTVALITIFVSVAEVLADSGFGRALVQKKNTTELDFNSVFYFSLVFSTVLYVLIFFAAPLIADFYNLPELVGILRIISITIVFHSVNSVQDAELSRKLLFNKSFRISLISSAVTAVTGVTLAILKYGPWALVWGKVMGDGAGVLSRWLIIAWRPRFMFSMSSLGQLFSFGWKMTVSSLVARIYSNLYGALIGKFYTKADLAFVNRARYIPGPVVDAIDGTLRRVTFPALAKVQDDIAKSREAMRMMMRCTMFGIFPLMCGGTVCAEQLVRILYGDQWLPMVPYVRVMCFTFAITPFHTINLQGIAALGRSDLFLRLEIIKKILGVICISITIRYGVMTIIVVSAFIMGPVGVIINSWPNRKLLNYSIISQIRDVFPNLIVCLPMGALCVLEAMIFSPVTLCGLIGLLVLQVISGGALYLSVAMVCKLQAAKDFANIIVVLMPNRWHALKRWMEKYAHG